VSDELIIEVANATCCFELENALCKLKSEPFFREDFAFEISKIAIEKNTMALLHVTDTWFSQMHYPIFSDENEEKLIKIALDTDIESFSLLSTDNQKLDKYIGIIVTNENCCLSLVPESHKTKSLCNEFISRDILNISHIPDNFQFDDIDNVDNFVKQLEIFGPDPKYAMYRKLIFALTNVDSRRLNEIATYDYNKGNKIIKRIKYKIDYTQLNSEQQNTTIRYLFETVKELRKEIEELKNNQVCGHVKLSI